jgi:hypothetical protein
MGLKAVANVSGGGTVTGTGTPGKLAKFATASSVGDSLLSESGTTITSAATAETFTSAQTWTLPSSATALTVGGVGAVLVLNTSQKRLGINCAPGTLLSVSDGIVAAPSYDGIRLGNTSQALFSSSDSIRGFYAGVTGGTVVAGSTTSHDLLLQRGGVTAITLGAVGAVTFAGNLTSSAAQTWTLATSTSALNVQSGLLNLDTTNSRVGIGTASPIGTLNVQGRVNVGGTALFNSTAVLSQVVGTSSSYYGAWKTTATSGGSVFGCGTNPFEIYAASGTLGSDTYLLRAYVDTSGNFLLNPLTTSAVFNASGTTQGIKLPSTPGNTDPHTLDCYLDGGVTAGGVSWTPTVGGNAAAWGGVLPVVASAKYSRVGNLVFCSVSLTGAALVASYGNNTITGPLAAGPTVYTAVPVSGGGNNGVGVQAGNTIYLPTIAGATAEIRLTWFYAV